MSQRERAGLAYTKPWISIPELGVGRSRKRRTARKKSRKREHDNRMESGLWMQLNRENAGLACWIPRAAETGLGGGTALTHLGGTTREIRSSLGTWQV